MNAANLVSALGGYYKGQKEAAQEREDIRRWEAGRQQAEQQIAIQREQLGVQRQQLIQQQEQFDQTQRFNAWKADFDMQLSRAQQVAELYGMDATDANTVAAIMGDVTQQWAVAKGIASQEARGKYETAMEGYKIRQVNELAVVNTEANDISAINDLEKGWALKGADYSHLDNISRREMAHGLMVPIITQMATAAVTLGTEEAKMEWEKARDIGAYTAATGNVQAAIDYLDGVQIDADDPNMAPVFQARQTALSGLQMMAGGGPGGFASPMLQGQLQAGGFGPASTGQPPGQDALQDAAYVRPLIQRLLDDPNVPTGLKQDYIKRSGLVTEGRTTDLLGAGWWWLKSLGPTHPAVRQLGDVLSAIERAPSPISSYGQQLMGAKPALKETAPIVRARLAAWGQANKIPGFIPDTFMSQQEFFEASPQAGIIEELKKKRAARQALIDTLGGPGAMIPSISPFPAWTPSRRRRG